MIESLVKNFKYGFIVEGFNDERTILKVMPEARFAVTNGTRYNNRVRMDIQSLVESCDTVFILTDPDNEGDRISNYILQDFEFERIHVDKKEAMCLRNNKWKTGVEHCDIEYLRSVIHEHILKKHLK